MSYCEVVIPQYTFFADSHVDGEIVCTRRVLVDGAENPFRCIILPISQVSQVLLHTVVAFAANDLRNQRTLPDVEQYDRMLLHHKQEAISLLREECTPKAGVRVRTLSERDGVLLAVALLCYIEIANGSKHEWFMHLDGCLSLIQHFGTMHKSSAFSPETLRFVYTVLILPHILCGTTLDWVSYQNLGDLAAAMTGVCPEFRAGDLTRIVPSNGLSFELLDIIHSISAISHKHSIINSQGAAGVPPGEAIALQHRLVILEQHFEEADPSHQIYLTAEAYRQAAFIFMHHALYGRSCNSAVIRDIHLPRLIDLLKQVHATEGELVGCLPYPLWTVLVAASFARDDDDRSFIMSLFTSLMSHRPKSNVPLTQAAVEAVWKKKDFDNVGSSPRSPTARLEWQETLFRLGWKMALI